MTSENENKLFISSIPSTVTKAQVLRYFSKYGEIVDSSPTFRVGSKAKICLVIEFKHQESKAYALSKTHMMKGRYLDCRNYMRGGDLHQRNLRLQRVNVYIPDIPKWVKSKDLQRELSSFGHIEQIKIGYSIKTKLNYSIITYREENSARYALHIGEFRLRGDRQDQFYKIFSRLAPYAGD